MSPRAPRVLPRSWRVTATMTVLAALLPWQAPAQASDHVPDHVSHQVSDAAVRASAEALPFDLPAPDVLRSSSRLVFAHYFPPLPLSLDNAEPARDYYARNYLSPDGERGKHRAYGGHLRDRPLMRPVRAGREWRLQDMQQEVRQAMAGGLDGFTLDLLALRGDANVRLWENAELLLRAARSVDPQFRVVLMPDMAGSVMSAKTPTALAAGVADLARHPSAYRLADGRLVVSPFKAEAHPASWWAQFLDAMRTRHGVRVAFLPVFLNEQRHAAAFDSISYGMSAWGSRNPAHNDPAATGTRSPLGRAAHVRRLGQKWMQPVSVQDERPRTAIYDEAQNTRNLRLTWQIARESGAEFVQVPTWNDYTEGTQLAPSVKHGWSYLDINAYYLTWYKTGAAPAIVRDTVYLTHRTQPHAADPTYPQTRLMSLRSGTPAQDTVEALTFLTAPATVRLTVGSRVHSCQVSAGVDSCVVPLGTGRVSAEVVRSGIEVTRVESPHVVTTTPSVQDLQYVAVGSGRVTSRWLAEAEHLPPAPSAAPAAPVSTPTGTPGASAPSVQVRPAVLVAGQRAEVIVRAAAGSPVELWAYTRPSTVLRLVRRGTADSTGRAVFLVAPSGNTRLHARTAGIDGALQSPSLVLPVAPAVGLSASRTGPRSFVFGGRVFPAVAGQSVTLTYATAAGNRVAASGRTASDGTYRIPRTFTGTASLVFTARTGASMTTATGTSRRLRVEVR